MVASSAKATASSAASSPAPTDSVAVLELELHLIDLTDPQARQEGARLLGSAQSEPGELERYLNSLADEQIDCELSLEELADLSGGLGLVDAMVSSTILMVMVSQSANLFGTSMNAISNSRLRDGLNAAINADLELVRHEVADWKHNEIQGQMAYAPEDAQCAAGTLGEALLADKAAALPVASTIDLSTAPTKLQGVQVNRTISVDPANKNLIRITYKTAAGSTIAVNQSTTLNTPAQGWCA